MNHSPVVCDNVGCDSIGTKSCGSCGEAKYCSVTCQKVDWGAHKKECVNVKNQSSMFLTCSKLEKLYAKVMNKSVNLESRKEYQRALKDIKLLLEYYLFQYGESVPNESCYIRLDGSRVDNYIICHIRSRLSNLYGCCPSDIESQDVVLANLVELRKMILRG